MAHPSLLARAAAVIAATVAMTASIASAPAWATAPRSAPTGLTPALGATVTSNPILGWKPVSGAVRYHVDVSTSSSFSSPTFSVDTPFLHATPATDLPLGQLYWRVKGLDASGASGPVATGSFVRRTTETPVPVAPANGAVLPYPGSPPRLSWSPVPGAKQYRVEIDDADDFLGATSVLTSNTSFVPTEPQTIRQPFYWHVQAVAGASNVSDFSPVSSYSLSWLERPVLLRPLNDTSSYVRDVEFEWSAVRGAATYELQVSPNGDYANNKSLDVTVKGTRYSPPITLDNSTYFWRVRAMDARTPAPNYGPWSDSAADGSSDPALVHQFTRGWSDPRDGSFVPRLHSMLSPSPDGTPSTSTPTFSWDPIGHSSQYELQVSRDPNFTPSLNPADPNPVSCITDHTSVTPYLIPVGNPEILLPPTQCKLAPWLAPGHTYWWRVRGRDTPAPLGAPFTVDALNGVFSAAQSFLLLPSDTPEESTPPNGTTVTSPDLRWTRAVGADTYRVSVWNAAGQLAMSPRTTAATSFTPTTPLTGSGPYTWEVYSVDKYGKPGLGLLSGSRLRFNLAKPTSTTSRPVLQAATLSASPRMPAMTWTSVSGAKTYQVYYLQNGIAFALTPAAGTPYTSFTYPDKILQDGTYGWFVEAYGDAGYLGRSDTGSFTVSPLPGAVMTAPASCTSDDCTPEQDTPTLKWNQVDDADFYRVYVSPDANFTNTTLKQYVTRFTTIRPIESQLDNQAGRSWYWYVRPCTYSNCAPFDSSVFPAAHRYRKQSPRVVPTSPANDDKVPDLPRFAWKDYADTVTGLPPSATGERPTQQPRQYRIQVSTVADFSTLLTDKTVDQTMYTPYDITYPEGPLFWRVQAIDGSGNQLTWSATQRLWKSSPQLTTLEPQQGATVSGLPSFRWDSQAFAAAYELEVYKNSDTLFSPGNRVLSQKTKLAAWSPTVGLPAGGYAWRVRRLDADARPGPWSDPRTFTFNPSGLTVLAPQPGATVGKSLVLQWVPVQGAASYQVEVSRSSSFTFAYDSARTAMSAFTPTRAYPDGQYYWRVTALDGTGNVLRRSAPTAFTLRFSLGDSTGKVLQSGSSQIRETWDVDTLAAASGGRYAVSSTPGAKVRITFAGKAITLLGLRAPNGGYADVAVDGRHVATASFYASTQRAKVSVWSTSSLSPRSHVLVLTVLSKRPAGSTGSAVAFDAARVGAAVLQEGSSAVRQSFAAVRSTRSSGGSYDTESVTARGDTGGKPTYSASFSGTGVNWYASRGPVAGKAYVILDGKRVAIVDLWAKSPADHVLVWRSARLTTRSHSLSVVVTGTARSGSKGTAVTVDSFVVS